MTRVGRRITAAGEEAFFVVRQRGASVLWLTDATTDGTVQVFDTTQVAANLSDTAVLGASLYFSAVDQNGQAELWRSDGTPGGPQPVLELHGEAPGSAPGGFVSDGDTLFFGAAATEVFGGPRGVWVTSGDGSRATLFARDPNRNHPFFSVTKILPHRPEVLFSTTTLDVKAEMWVSAGPGSETTRVAEVLGSPPVRTAVATREGLFLFTTVARCDESFEVWGSQGTVADAVKLVELNADGPCVHPTAVSASAAGFTYFSFFDGSNWNLWRSDNTPGGTVLVARLGLAQPWAMTAVGNAVFVRTGYEPAQLWRSDGTEAGTEKIGLVDVGSMAALGSELLVSADDGVIGRELFRISPSGQPELVRDISTLVGDCSGDAVVRIDELVVGTRIALGVLPVTTCVAFDADGDGAVAITELTAGVRSALVGCS